MNTDFTHALTQIMPRNNGSPEQFEALRKSLNLNKMNLQSKIESCQKLAAELQSEHAEIKGITLEVYDCTPEEITSLSTGELKYYASMERAGAIVFVYGVLIIWAFTKKCTAVNEPLKLVFA